MRFGGGQSDTETVSAVSIPVLPCQYHSTNAPFSSLSTYCSYQKDKLVKLKNLPKNALTEIGECWLTLFVFCKEEKYITVYSGLPIVLLTLLHNQH